MGVTTFHLGVGLSMGLMALGGCKREPAKAKVMAAAPGLPPCESFNITVDIFASGGAVPSRNVPFTAVRCDADSGYLESKDGGNVPDLVKADYDSQAKSVSLRSTVVMPKSGADKPFRFTARLDLPAVVAIPVSTVPAFLELAPGGNSGEDQGASLVFNHGAVTCDYVSASGAGYKLSRCVQGGQPMTTAAVIDNVGSIEFRIFGGAPHYITTADLMITHK